MKTVWHVTYKDNLEGILQDGLMPSNPIDFNDERGVYCFPNIESMEDALANWLGDRLDESKEIVLIQLNIEGLNFKEVNNSYEIIVYDTINPERIIGIHNES